VTSLRLLPYIRKFGDVRPRNLTLCYWGCLTRHSASNDDADSEGKFCSCSDRGCAVGCLVFHCCNEQSHTCSCQGNALHFSPSCAAQISTSYHICPELSTLLLNHFRSAYRFHRKIVVLSSIRTEKCQPAFWSTSNLIFLTLHSRSACCCT
jgi:hypothetical protein